MILNFWISNKKVKKESEIIYLNDNRISNHPKIITLARHNSNLTYEDTNTTI